MKKRIVSLLLCLAMIVALIPMSAIESEATPTKDIDVDTSKAGEYTDCYIGDSASQTLVINGSFGTDESLTVEHSEIERSLEWKGTKRARFTHKFSGADAQWTLGGTSVDIESYNAMKNFGKYKMGTGMGLGSSDGDGAFGSEVEVIAATPGFTHSGTIKINTAYAGDDFRRDDWAPLLNASQGESASLEIKIADNPTLKALAETGDLQFYFYGDVLGALEERTGINRRATGTAWLKIRNSSVYSAYKDNTITLTSGSTNGSNNKNMMLVKYFSTTQIKSECSNQIAKDRTTSDGWYTLDVNDTIIISYQFEHKGTKKWPNREYGVGNCVLLFRKASQPTLTTYTLTTNGNVSTSSAGEPQILLDNYGQITLDLEFSEPVTSALDGKTMKNSSDYNLLYELGNRKLFTNTQGTGYYRQGEPVYMNLTKYTNSKDGDYIALTTPESRAEALGGYVQKLHYEYNATYGDYYGNNPVPGDGDWAGVTTASNQASLLDELYMASFHDLAGNPVLIGGESSAYTYGTTNLLYDKLTLSSTGVDIKDVYIKDSSGNYIQLVQKTRKWNSVDALMDWSTGDRTGIQNGNYYVRRDHLLGTVIAHNKTIYNVGNPFAATTSADSSNSGYRFIIDAVSPTFTKTSNAVQPEVLTNLTLNYGDEFEIYLNFSENVWLRKFKANGTATNYSADNLFLQLSNGMKAKYTSGIGTKQLTFKVTVPDGSAFDTATALEIENLYITDSSGKNVALSGVNTTDADRPTAVDYVLTDYVGNPMVGEIGKVSEGTSMAWANLLVDNTKPGITFTANADKTITITATDNQNVFHISNTTGDADNQAGLVFYTWVSGKDNADQVLSAFVANNYEMVKKTALGAAASVTVGDKTYKLTTANNNVTLSQPTETGEWYLLAFTSDMTWDSARQLIQFGNASYKTNATDYYTKLAAVLGLDASSMFEELKTKPSDWETNYTNYYTMPAANTYEKIPTGKTYPEWKAGTYYDLKYVLKNDVTEADWSPYKVATDAQMNDAKVTKYTKANTGNYVPLAQEAVQATKAVEKVYIKDETNSYLAYVTGSIIYDAVSTPSVADLESDQYFVKNSEGGYQEAKSTDSFTVDTKFYQLNSSKSKFTAVARVTETPVFRSGVYYNRYTVKTLSTLTDVEYSNAKNYFLRELTEDEDAVYESVFEACAPEYDEENTYLRGAVKQDAGTMDGYEYTRQTSAPADWDTNYTAYYMKDEDTYSTFTVNGKAICTGTDMVPNSVPWKASAAYDYTDVADKLYESTGTDLFIKVSSAPEDWESTYTDYYYKEAIAPLFSADTYYEIRKSTATDLTDDGIDVCTYNKLKDEYTVKTDATEADLAEGYSVILLDKEPADWETTYKDYYTVTKTTGSKATVYTAESVPENNYIAAYPEFKADTYYKKNYVAATEEDFEEDYYSLYTRVNGNYVLPSEDDEVPETFAEDTYYKAQYELLSEEPENWKREFASYYTMDPAHFTQYLPELSVDMTVYVKASSPELLTAEPEDWADAFYFYSTEKDQDAPVQYVTAPLDRPVSTEGKEQGQNKYWLYTEVEFKTEPSNWADQYDRYYYRTAKTNGEFVSADLTTVAQRDAAVAAGLTLTNVIPTWGMDEGKSGILEETGIETVYQAASGEGSVTSIANADGVFENSESGKKRKEAFIDEMLLTTSYGQRVTTLRKYSEFAKAVRTADTQMMANAANYDGWGNRYYRALDSNWTQNSYGAIDLIPPEVSFEITGENTENAVLNVKVEDMTDNLGVVKYQFVPEGTEVNESTLSGWTTVDVKTNPSKTTEFTASTQNDKLLTGTYDFCVYVEDAQGNSCIEKRTVTINTEINIITAISTPEGTAPYKRLYGMTVDVSGTLYGDDLFAESRGYTLYAAIDENPTKELTSGYAAEGWTLLSGTKVAGAEETTYRYNLPTLSGKNGYYYLHLASTYISGGTTYTKYVNKAYALNGAVSDITFNQVSATEDSITVEVSAVNAESIQYAILDNLETELTATTGTWNNYSQAIELRTADYPGKTAVRVWAKADGVIRSQVFNLNGSSKPTGEVPEVTANDISLVDLYTEKNTAGENVYYAILRIDSMNDKTMSPGSEYSVSVAPSADGIGDLTWQRWMPMDNTIKVKIGTSLDEEMSVRFKFRNGENDSGTEYPAVKITKTTATTGEPWAVVSRSTLREVGVKDGVTLNFTCKKGYKVAGTTKDNAVKVLANGVYSNQILTTDGIAVTEEATRVYSVVSNVNTNPPTYTVTWSDNGEHEAAASVRMMISSEDNISVVAATFRNSETGVTEDVNVSVKSTYKEDGTIQYQATYEFSENGILVVTIANEAGNTVDVRANVNWLDNTPLRFERLYADYQGYSTFGTGDDILASGLTLNIVPNKVSVQVAVNGEVLEDGVLSYTIEKNGSYKVSAVDSQGRSTSQVFHVTNIVKSMDAPEVVKREIVKDEVTQKTQVKVTLEGTYNPKNPVYDGKWANPEKLVTNDGSKYTITRTYEHNGEYTNYLTDSIGNTMTYVVNIKELDEDAPTITLPESALSINATKFAMDEEGILAEFKRLGLSVSDKKDGSNVTIDIADTSLPDTTVIGAYSVLIIAKDQSGNESYARTTVYILPTTGLIVRDQNGVLFCSASKDASLVDRNGERNVELSIRRYNLLDMIDSSGDALTVYNKEATVEVIVKQGIYREGQMKYFATVAAERITFTGEEENAIAKVVLSVEDDIPKTGWYTVIVRNSEREREYTTFFVSSDDK